MLYEVSYCFRPRTPDRDETPPLFGYVMAIDDVLAAIDPFTEAMDKKRSGCRSDEGAG